MSEFRIERLAKHSREDFDCGVDVLNKYLATRASQEMRRRYAVCYVLVETTLGKVVGFYTLSACSIPLTDLPVELAKRLPQYPGVPAARIGRLAIDLRNRSRGLGGALLYDAVKRTSESDIAAYALIVDAKDAAAVQFYEHFGFSRFASTPSILFLPLEK